MPTITIYLPDKMWLKIKQIENPSKEIQEALKQRWVADDG